MITDDLKLPMYSEDLIKMLNVLYPVKSANIKDSEREIFLKVGQREVVETLNNLLYDKKNKNKINIEGFSEWESVTQESKE